MLECLDGVRSERVAVKIFAGYDARGGGRDALARFEREVRVLGTLDHPNIVPLRDYVPEGPALVLAWMGRGTLEQMIESEPLAPARAVEIARAVLAALGEAHRLGVIHRDIKPANVLFDDAGVTRLGDFGVAHLSDLSATATAGVIGTLGYMSPEQREGRPASVRSDLYGVGAMLWEMLTGERPEPRAPARRRARGRAESIATSTRVTTRWCSRSSPRIRAAARRTPSPPGARSERSSGRARSSALPYPASNGRRASIPSALRLAPQDDGTAIDRWIDRRVVTLDLDADARARVGLRTRRSPCAAGRAARRSTRRARSGSPHLAARRSRESSRPHKRASSATRSCASTRSARRTGASIPSTSSSTTTETSSSPSRPRRTRPQRLTSIASVSRA